ncbi:ribonuclease [Novosphingobium nitrogenifigens DSM 19370]|uniref:Ribonuclease n=1 Tax=Novosphingobium nitrogenifigens DSM 19370 TaxID=983920 RepID=F1ZDI2_9SPHN|nr:hypothetical protein [Novosphingobium nitrogenifigens]EGD57277.1 ribonuclease [Novosphingobium nitrogenifigens DSM 19370]
MPEWLVEEGIGETRAILVDDDAETILAARLCWHEPWRAGAVAQARLSHRRPGSRGGAVVLPDETIALVDALPPGLTEGARLLVRITRAALAEKGRFKLAQCRPAPDASPSPAPPLAQDLRETEFPVRVLGALARDFDKAGWDELVEQAQSGEVDFPGGRLTFSPTPAMTLIDVDGTLPLRDLALASARAIAQNLARLDIAGSVGIDFPTIEGRTDRQAVDTTLGDALAALPGGWRGERTGMNGFGFVQLVSRLARPSLLSRHAHAPARAAAFALLRQAERVSEPGILLLVAHPAVLAAIDSTFESELARRTGRTIHRDPRPTLALHAGFAQAIVS